MMLNRIAKVQFTLLLWLYMVGARATSMPWDTGLCSFANALLGKTAFCIALAAIFGAGSKLIFGEEVTGIVKSLLAIVIVIGILVGGASIYRLVNPGGITCNT
ncbi:TrbC/VirB2 family protein [Trinickia mobilis]|uniref:TrbC/VirB2 family protein n=1 Tax=Trinickia mobilis TaxID=2816356 RepID=UPI001A9061A0|nr:TrbC/VirB2 family protein [Trinickia mobilis]